ncbi:MAG: hypothetical protein H0W88_02265 [Parachlamydiaceae bacterium]|nr:hypothetical protein [Parachlamydiaceae bacterium]
MNEQMGMMICMIVTMLFVVVIGIAIIIQTFLQAKMLKELRRLNASENDKHLNS